MMNREKIFFLMITVKLIILKKTDINENLIHWINKRGWEDWTTVLNNYNWLILIVTTN